MNSSNENITPRQSSIPSLQGAAAEKAGMRIAFKMKLFPGKEAEYQKRHNEIWPELQLLLKNTGISDYSIFLDKETNSLFGVLTVLNINDLTDLPKHAVMQQWWKFMADLMETNEDQSPVSIPLKEVFYLP